MRSDLTKVRQTLLNLLSNAAESTEGGTITLSASRRGDRLSFAVRDSGIGMTDQQMSRLFGRFAQAAASATARFGGTVAVASDDGRGSTSTVELPAEVPAG